VWSRRRQLLQRRSGSSAGFTLVELLVSISIGLIVFVAALNLIVVGLHKQNDVANRIDSLQQARAGAGRLTRDLRQATLVSVTNGGSGILYTLPAQGLLGVRAVTWVCAAGGTCTRTELAASRTVMTGVANVGSVTAPIFAMPATNQVAVQLQLTANAKTYTLQDAVNLRNLTPP
jgi:prepilin-type N-terminal cleavage/methylation domain-containing protein